MNITWENNRFKVALYGEDYDEIIGYTLVIDGKAHGGPGNAATEEQETEFRDHAREIVAAFRNPLQGARRRRRKTKKTKKASKKRRSTKRR
jgi:hypothetical protein